ncbi:methyltransferase [Shewanella marisflavi]|uniref:tRNA1(Val) (adenine(37)-N6)-methyltransferase n=1 Tax=Shewanella marisflavi TaxID=260364 RepID=UPI00200D394F|nr:methyltransferase [Shewanella marisflavi]MCL1041761.1 methyltransferase [Shewanella marisflavi]
MPFSFKQFHIDDSRCGMPVSTDGVLLGAWAPLTQAQNILDIGAGSGLLSLMAAQRSHADITALEIEPLAAQDCQHNIDQSPWTDRIRLIQADLLDWYVQAHIQFDHILCNPPYFENGPQSQCDKRAQARHTDSLSFDALLKAIKQLLSPTGQASLILPSASIERFLGLLPSHELSLQVRFDVASVSGKTAHRHLLTLGHQRDKNQDQDCHHPVATQTLCVRDSKGHYSEAMIALTRAFYLKL